MATEENKRTYKYTGNLDATVHLEDDGIVVDIYNPEEDEIVATGWMSLEDLHSIIQREDYFSITSIHRGDLEELGYDTDEISDNQMKRLANKMADDYLNQLFHMSMRIIAEDMNLPKKED